jgi:energy-coupling factor transporter ATP-binding protein EcfA2
MARSSRLGVNACVGRDELAAAVVRSASEAGAVLLFGGRQSGKSTLLRHIASKLRVTNGVSGHLSALVLPVLLDLMTLPYDAQPSDFFRVALQETLGACASQVNGFALPSALSREPTTLDSFIDNLSILKVATGNVDVSFLFLVLPGFAWVKGRMAIDSTPNRGGTSPCETRSCTGNCWASSRRGR